MTLDMQFLAWDRHKHVAELDHIMGLQSSPLNNWIPNGFTDINKLLKKNLHRSHLD